jgi:hypothetical protein
VEVVSCIMRHSVAPTVVMLGSHYINLRDNVTLCVPMMIMSRSYYHYTTFELDI